MPELRNFFIRMDRDEQVTIDEPYEGLISSLPQDFVGSLLHLSGRFDDMDRWGRELMEVASSLFQEPPITPEHRGFTRFEINDKGIVSVHHDTDDPDVFFGRDTSSWGIDYENPKDFQGVFAVDLSDDDTELAAWNRDRKRLESWAGYQIGEFQAREALEIWASRNSNEFLRFAERYLKGLDQAPQHHWSLGLFTDAILCLLLPRQPDTAMKFYRKWRDTNIKVVCSTTYGVSTFLTRLWDVQSCHLPEHKQFRQELLEECPNDEKIMFMTLVALSGGGREELLNFAKQYRQSSCAKDRNLCVSILPWVATSQAIDLLDELRTSDPSQWVRDHAKWAYEVAQQERSCQEVYRNALRTKDVLRISAALAQMKPTLLPTARWWSRQIEDEVFVQSPDNDPKRIAHLFRFWYHWQNSSRNKQHIKAFGRTLDQHCRGEKLQKTKTSRLAPWWKAT